MKIHIQGGTLIDPAAGTETQADVFIAAGKIVAIGEASADFDAARVIDAKGLALAPGFVDLKRAVARAGL